jgi:hypothetical protein
MKKVLFSIALASFTASPLLAFGHPAPVTADEGKDQKKDEKKAEKKGDKKGENKDDKKDEGKEAK